ncbi:hypothetical protein Bca4012_044535 [Brassica carinata]
MKLAPSTQIVKVFLIYFACRILMNDLLHPRLTLSEKSYLNTKQRSGAKGSGNINLFRSIALLNMFHVIRCAKTLKPCGSKTTSNMLTHHLKLLVVTISLQVFSHLLKLYALIYFRSYLYFGI